MRGQFPKSAFLREIAMPLLKGVRDLFGDMIRMALKLNIIIASTRPGRGGPAVAKWFNDFAKADGKFEPVLVDLADYDLPILDEPNHPRMKKYEHEHTKKWSEIIDLGDAYVFVTPEYDYNAPPSLINALIYLWNEWNYKPASFVSYGGISGGLRAVEFCKRSDDRASYGASRRERADPALSAIHQ